MISYEEFKQLKKGPKITSSQITRGTKHFVVGQKYYVEALDRRKPDWIKVYKGTFQEMRPSGAVVLSDKEPVANIREGEPLGNPILNGFVYYKAFPTSPTQEDLANKRATMKEMSQLHGEQKAEPFDTTPPYLSYRGEDYREIMANKNRTRSRSRSKNSRTRSRSRSRSPKN
jgi:hypothetical protein